jgi:hypothetical protein
LATVRRASEYDSIARRDPDFITRVEPHRRLIGSIPKIGATVASARRRGADTALHGAATALNRIFSRRRKSFELDNLRHITALTALGR